MFSYLSIPCFYNILETIYLLSLLSLAHLCLLPRRTWRSCMPTTQDICLPSLSLPLTVSEQSITAQKHLPFVILEYVTFTFFLTLNLFCLFSLLRPLTPFYQAHKLSFISFLFPSRKLFICNEYLLRLLLNQLVDHLPVLQRTTYLYSQASNKLSFADWERHSPWLTVNLWTQIISCMVF